MTKPTIVLFTLLSITLAACGGGESRWAGTVTDSAGVAIVANPAEGVWDTDERWTVEEEVRIGALEGSPEYQFGQIGGMTVDSEGRVFVLDAQAQHIQVYNPDGSYERTIGKKGGGPGELQGAIFVLMGPGDTLLVPDMQNQRVNRYAPDGSSLGSFRLSLEKGLPMQFRATPSGILAQQLRPFALPGQPTPEMIDAIVVINPDGTVIDTLKTFPSGETIKLSGAAPEINIYSPEPVWELTEEMRLLFGVNDQYNIGVYSPDGGLERIIRKPFELKPVADRDRQVVIEFLERTWGEAGVPPEALSQLRNMVHFGDAFPAFSTIAAGPVGTIWVQHIQAASELSEEELESYNLIEDAGARDWDVFDSEGRLLGVISMPPRFAPRIFRGDKIYGVWRDELDVQYVVRLRIVGDLASLAT